MLVALGQFALHRLLLLFSGGNGEKPPWESWAALPVVGSAVSLQPSPSSYLHPKTPGAEAAPHSKLAQFLAQEADE